MKHFVIGYLNFFDNAMTLSKVEASSKEEALRNYLRMDLTPEGCEDISEMSYEDILDYCLDGEIAIDVIEI